MPPLPDQFGMYHTGAPSGAGYGPSRGVGPLLPSARAHSQIRRKQPRTGRFEPKTCVNYHRDLVFYPAKPLCCGALATVRPQGVRCCRKTELLQCRCPEVRHHLTVRMPSVPSPGLHAGAQGAATFSPTTLITHHFVTSFDEYIQLFAEATPQHLRVGEASAAYLLSSAAIGAIREFSPDAKIIAIFRNPVDMVYSFHSQLLYWSEETENDFEIAWRRQECRRMGIDVPRTCQEPFCLQYRDIGQFGTQTHRLLSVFPPKQVKLILSDDLATSPQRIYDEVIDFFEISHDQRSEFPRANENKRARLTCLRDFYPKAPLFPAPGLGRMLLG